MNLTSATSFGNIGSDPVPLTVYAARASLTQTPSRYAIKPDGSMPVTYTITYANESSVPLSGATLIADMEQADLTRDVTELRTLEAARQRFDRGEYGVCTDCGGDIAFERLRAFPQAVRCVDCQRRYEKTFDPTPRPSL